MSLVDRIVQVVFRGKDEVSAPAEKSAGAVEGFAGKVGSLLKGLAALAAGLALADFFKKAVAEATTSREAMGQLALTVENSGKSFAKMSPEIDATLNRLARMTKFGDDDFARAMQQMTLKTGDADWSLQNLGQAADLAAAGNIDLEQAANMLAQAHEGNTKALFKMMPELKGAANWQERLAERTAGAAEAQMRQLGPLAAIEKMFGEVAESVGKAILGNTQFEESGFQVATVLAHVANWIEANSGELGKFVDVLVETAKNLVESLTPAFQVLMRGAGPVLKVLAGLLAEVGFLIRALSVIAEESAGNVIQAIGWIVEKGAKVLRAFGIDVGSGLAETLTQFGQKLETEASQRWTKMTQDHEAFWDRMKKRGDAATVVVEQQEKAKTQAVKGALGDQEKATKDAIAAQQALWKLVDDTAVSYRKTIETLKPAIEQNVTRREIDAQATALDAARDNAASLIAKMKEHGELPPLVKHTSSAIGEVGDRLSEAAGYALDAASEIGGMDDEAKALLQSCKDVGDAVANIAKSGLSFAGVTGLMGGVASIVSNMMAGDKERRELTRQNTEALNKLRTDGVRLSNKASGDQIAGIAGLDPNLIGMLGQMTSDPMRANGNQLLTRALAQAGLRLSDLDVVSAELGFNLRRDNGQIDLSQLPAFFKALQDNMGQLTRIGQTFSEQLAFFKESQRLVGAGGTTQITDLLTFLQNVGGSSAFGGIDLTDPTAARKQLLDLFVGLNNNTLSPGTLGNLTGEQFRSVVVELIGLVDGLSKAVTTATTTANPIATASQVTVAGLGTIDVTSGAAESVQDLLRAQTETLSATLTVHTDLHTRVASATEACVAELQVQTGLLAAIAASFDSQADQLNAALAQARAVAQVNAGVGPSF